MTLHSPHPLAPKPRAALGSLPAALGAGCVSAHPPRGIVFQQCVLGAGCSYSRAGQQQKAWQCQALIQGLCMFFVSDKQTGSLPDFTCFVFLSETQQNWLSTMGYV